MKEKLKIAVVGSGWVTENRHLPILLRNREWEVFGIIARNAERVKYLSKKFGIERCANTQNLGEINWLEKVDAVLIGTAPIIHASQVIEALNCGKHVLVEKPFALNLEEGRFMCETARKNDKILAVMHNLQFSCSFKKLEQEIQQKQLGRISRISFVHLTNSKRKLPIWHEELPLGSFYDESSHMLYLMRKFAGKDFVLEKAYAVKTRDAKRNTPSSVFLLYRNEEKVPITVDCFFNSPISEWHALFYGENGLGIIDIYRDFYIRLPNDKEHDIFSVMRTSICGTAQHLWQYIPNGLKKMMGKLNYGCEEVLDNFAEAIRGDKDALKGISMEEGFKVLEIQNQTTIEIQKNMLS